LSPLAGAVLTGRNFGAGLFQLGLELLRKLKLVFEELQDAAAPEGTHDSAGASWIAAALYRF
jgi:hypothetical protein